MSIAGANVGMADHDPLDAQSLVHQLGEATKGFGLLRAEQGIVRIEVSSVPQLDLGDPWLMSMR